MHFPFGALLVVTGAVVRVSASLKGLAVLLIFGVVTHAQSASS